MTSPLSPTAPRWSPYVAGAGLGLTAAVSMALFGKRLSGSGAWHQLAGPIGRRLDGDSVYFHRVLAHGMTWEIWLLVGTLLGALASALLSRQFRLRAMPDAEWADAWGPSVLKRWLIVFAGTALIELAAGIAGGCTASLAVSGGAAAAPGAFAFMAGMFGGGIPAALLVHRLALRRKEASR